MWHVLRRIFTLPKSRNSLDDVLPDALAAIAKERLREMVRQEVKRMFDRFYGQRDLLEKEMVRFVWTLMKIDD